MTYDWERVYPAGPPTLRIATLIFGYGTPSGKPAPRVPVRKVKLREVRRGL